MGGHDRHTQRVATRPEQRVAPPQTGHTIGGGAERGRGFFSEFEVPFPILPRQPDHTQQYARRHLIRKSICRATPTAVQRVATRPPRSHCVRERVCWIRGIPISTNGTRHRSGGRACSYARPISSQHETSPAADDQRQPATSTTMVVLIISYHRLT